MIIRFKWSEIEARPEEVLELLKLAAGGSESVPLDMNECDGDTCVGDCDKCDKAVPADVKTKLKEIRSEVEEVQKKQKKSKSKTELDVPKMRALRKAGWTLTKIADEMRCSPQTVANRLREA